MKMNLFIKKTQSVLWDEKALSEIDNAIAKANDPIAEANRQAGKGISDYQSARRRYQILSIIALLLGALVLTSLIIGGAWYFRPYPDSDTTSIEQPTATVMSDEASVVLTPFTFQSESLGATGQDTHQWNVIVADDQGQLLSDIQVVFEVQSGEAAIDSTSVTDQYGRATAKITINDLTQAVILKAYLPDHGNVAILTETIAVESLPDLQMIIDRSNIPSELKLDTQFDLVFQITNTGNAIANNVFVHSNLPNGVEFVPVAEQGHTCQLMEGQEQIVACQVGQIASGKQSQVRARLKVINDQSDVELRAENYWVMADAMNPVYGTEALNFPVTVPTPSLIELTANPSKLYISGSEQLITQTEVIATVYDQWNQLYNREALPIIINTSIPEAGSFDSVSQSLVGGTASFHYTAAQQPASLTLTATVSSPYTTTSLVSNLLELNIAQVTSPTVGVTMPEQVFLNSEDVTPFLTQITAEWPIEIVGQPQSQRYPVAVRLWVARELIDIANQQLLLSNIDGDETVDGKILFASDKEPTTYPAEPFTDWGGNYPRMYKNDQNIQIEIENDDPEKPYVLVHVKGWIPVNQINAPTE